MRGKEFLAGFHRLQRRVARVTKVPIREGDVPIKVPRNSASGCRPVLRCDVELLVMPNFSSQARSLHTVDAVGSIDRRVGQNLSTTSSLPTIQYQPPPG